MVKWCFSGFQRSIIIECNFHLHIWEKLLNFLYSSRVNYLYCCQFWLWIILEKTFVVCSKLSSFEVFPKMRWIFIYPAIQPNCCLLLGRLRSHIFALNQNLDSWPTLLSSSLYILYPYYAPSFHDNGDNYDTWTSNINRTGSATMNDIHFENVNCQDVTADCIPADLIIHRTTIVQLQLFTTSNHCQ